MDFRTFFVRKVVLSFCVSVTGIILGMAVLGLLFQPQARFGYEAFFSPLIFAFIGSLSLIVKYSSHELTLREALARNVLHFILLEATILSFLYVSGLLESVSMTVSLALMILLINLFVHLVLWIHDQKIASEINAALKILQENHQPIE